MLCPAFQIALILMAVYNFDGCGTITIGVYAVIFLHYTLHFRYVSKPSGDLSWTLFILLV